MADPELTHANLAARLERMLGGRATLRGQLLRGGIGSMAVKSANLLLNLAAAVMLARLLGPAGYGTYSFFLSVVMLLAVPAMFGMPRLLIREVATYQLHEQWSLLRGILRRSYQVATVLVLLIGMLALLIGGEPGKGFAGRETLLIGMLLLPFLALNSLCGAALRGLCRVVQGQMAEMVFIPGLLVVFSAAVALTVTLTPAWVMLAHAGAALSAFLIGTGLLSRALPAPVQRVTPAYNTRAWLSSVWPFGLIAGMQVINNQADILMLGVLSDTTAVGLYRVAAQASLLVSFGHMALNMVLGPHVTRLYQQNDRDRLQRMVKASARFNLLIAVPVAMLFMLFGDSLLALVFGADYRGAYIALTMLVVGQLGNVAAGSVALLLNMSGHEKLTAAGLGGATLVNILLNTILIPRFGINGAAIATVATLACWNGVLLIAVRRRLQIRPSAF